MPWIFTAVRCPANTSSRLWPCASMPRTLPMRTAPPAAGKTSTSSPSRNRPVESVPVATVPNPLTVKTRSSGSRSGPSVARAPAAAASRSISARSAGTPAPVTAEHGMIAAGSRTVSRSSVRTSSVTSASQSSLTRSILVSATSARRIPSSRQMSRCSRVCGIGPSSAAMTRMQRSIPLAPGDHRAHEALVPGHVDHRHRVARGRLEVRESEVDGDAARLLLGQSVGVDPGQRSNQRGLAVIDVPRGPDDDAQRRGGIGRHGRILNEGAAPARPFRSEVVKLSVSRGNFPPAQIWPRSCSTSWRAGASDGASVRYFFNAAVAAGRVPRARSA